MELAPKWGALRATNRYTSHVPVVPQVIISYESIENLRKEGLGQEHRPSILLETRRVEVPGASSFARASMRSHLLAADMSCTCMSFAIRFL